MLNPLVGDIVKNWCGAFCHLCWLWWYPQDKALIPYSCLFRLVNKQTLYALVSYLPFIHCSLPICWIIMFVYFCFLILILGFRYIWNCCWWTNLLNFGIFILLNLWLFLTRKRELCVFPQNLSIQYTTLNFSLKLQMLNIFMPADLYNHNSFETAFV